MKILHLALLVCLSLFPWEGSADLVVFACSDFFLKLAFSAVLVLLGGVFAGLTLGLMGMSFFPPRI
jgi:hypothetical protein